MKIIATIEARMTSSRLPGKVLLPAAGKPMLQHLVSRLRKISALDKIVIATTVNKTDDILEEFAKKESIGFFRGSEEDVMSRVLGAAKAYAADIIVEITADCPIIDPVVVDLTLQLFLNNPCDYASNVIVRSYPIGMDTQVYRTEILEKSLGMTKHPLDREHVTRHIRQNPQLFRQLHLFSPFTEYWPELAITLTSKPTMN
jgi:spore coat polysaccharide biosynthesis protein SpsF